MTHSLHRVGTINSLKNDFTVIVRPERGYNQVGAAVKLRKTLEYMNKNGAVNICGARGENYNGTILETSLESIKSSIKDNNTVFGCFDEKSDLINFLKDMIKADFGLSVVVQGLYSEVEECCQNVGLKPHTTNHSLGIWGNKTLLPDKHILEFTTMCGHGCVSAALVEEQICLVRTNKVSLSDAVSTIAKPCLCGIVNPKRTERLLQEFL